MWLNGVNVGDTPGPCSNGGTIVADGLTIGSNNNGGPTNIDSQLIGAIDAIRFSTVAPSATQICERAGLTGCSGGSAYRGCDELLAGSPKDFTTRWRAILTIERKGFEPSTYNLSARLPAPCADSGFAGL